MHDGTGSCGCMRKDATKDSLERQGKIPGVSYSGKTGEYVVNRTFGAKKYYIGKRKTPEEAIALRDEANRVQDDYFLEWLADYRRSRKGRKMTDKQYSTCVTEAQNYTDRDAYISDMVLSSMWGDDPAEDIPEDRIEQMHRIYDAVHRSVKDIAALAGLNITNMAARFSVPYRTMQDWFSGARVCSLAIRLMMQECLGIYTPPIGT